MPTQPNLLERARAALQQGQQYAPGMTTIPGQRVGKTEQDASYDYEMPTWLYNAAGPNAIGQAQAAGSTARTGGYGGAISQSINTIGGKNLYAARSPFQDMQGYTDNRNIYVRDPANPGAWLSYDALSPDAKAALQGKYSALNGTNYNVLDANGNVIGQRAFTGLKDQDHVNDVMMAVAGAALGGIAAMGAGAGAGVAGAETGGSLAGSGAGFVGEGVASGVPAWDAALAASPSWVAPAAAATGGAVFNPAVDSQLANTQLGLTAADTSSTVLPSVTVNGVPSGGFSLSDILPGGGGSGSSLIPGVSNKTLVDLGTTAIGSLGGKGGSVPDLTGDEAARQAKQQAAIDAINERFGYGASDTAKTNKTARDSMYGDISGAVSEAALRDLNKQFTTASNRNTFGLARSGLMGGSVDAESGGDLQERYGEGKMRATQAGLGAASDLRSQDEQTRQRLVSLAQSGLDVGTANSMAAGEMQSAADSAKASAAGTTVGRLFDDMSQAYAMNGYLKARYPNGTAPAPASYSSNNLFGTNRYTGRVQG